MLAAILVFITFLSILAVLYGMLCFFAGINSDNPYTGPRLANQGALTAAIGLTVFICVAIYSIYSIVHAIPHAGG